MKSQRRYSEADRQTWPPGEGKVDRQAANKVSGEGMGKKTGKNEPAK